MNLQEDDRAAGMGGDPVAVRQGEQAGPGPSSLSASKPAKAAGSLSTTLADEETQRRAPASGGARPGSKDHRITRPALDHLDDLRRENFIRFGNMRIADHVAVGEVMERLTVRDGVVDLKPQSPTDRRVAERLRQKSMPARASEVAAGEPDDIARRRRDWDEAKRTGDPDAMTRTANALLRAVEEARAHLGPDEAGLAAPHEAGRHPTSEILNPQSDNERPPSTANENADAPPTDGSIAESGELPKFDATAEGLRTGTFPAPDVEVNPDDELPSGESARLSLESTSESDNAQSLTARQARTMARAIVAAPEDRRERMVRDLYETFGETVAEQVLRHLPRDPTMFALTSIDQPWSRARNNEAAAAPGRQAHGRDGGDPQRRRYKTAQSPELPAADVSELTDDPPVISYAPSQPPEVPLAQNGVVCVRATCRSTKDRNVTDQGMPLELRLFELRIIKKLYGPEATRAWMKRDERQYHAYHNISRFRAPPGTTIEEVREKLRLWAAPQATYDRPQRDRPVVSGDESELHVDYDVIWPFWYFKGLGLTVPLRGGMVTHYFDEASGAVANVTQPDHMLHPGYILRWVEELPDGTFVLHTLGRGLGAVPRINERSGATMFTELDDAIIGDLDGTVME